MTEGQKKPEKNMRLFEGEIVAGHYRLDKYLDEGGFGAVYRATNLAFGLELRQVAIKIAKRPLSDREARDIFSDAIKMSKLADSASDQKVRRNFITIHDVGRCHDDTELAGHPYMVMEFIRSGSLGAQMRSGPFPLKRTSAYFEQMLDALAFMHRGIADIYGRREPIIHRDLKPGNFLIVRGKDGDIVKVTDFGLAITTDNVLGWVDSGGDLTYMAPESFSHNISSPKTDVYQLGLIFYEMLTGKSPFGAVGSHLEGNQEENLDELRRIHLLARQKERFEHLERHEEIRRRPRLGAVIRYALATDMESRKYANACELQDAWNRAKSGNQTISDEQPWETAGKLIAEAEQCMRVGDRERAESLLNRGMEINRDPSLVPDRVLVAKGYLLMVEQMLKKGEVEGAGELASEGHRRRVCKSTCSAMAAFFEAKGSPLARSFKQEAQDCNDRS